MRFQRGYWFRGLKLQDGSRQLATKENNRTPPWSDSQKNPEVRDQYWSNLKVSKCKREQKNSASCQGGRGMESLFPFSNFLLVYVVCFDVSWLDPIAWWCWALMSPSRTPVDVVSAGRLSTVHWATTRTPVDWSWRPGDTNELLSVSWAELVNFLCTWQLAEPIFWFGFA